MYKLLKLFKAGDKSFAEENKIQNELKEYLLDYYNFILYLLNIDADLWIAGGPWGLGQILFWGVLRGLLENLEGPPLAPVMLLLIFESLLISINISRFIIKQLNILNS